MINPEHSPPKYEYCNPAYEAEEASESIPEKPANCENEDPGPQRQQWGSPVEFLMSCISMSVGLGNVWRFPVTAYENGGGAFLIPYLIVLLIIGRPLYYLEMILGQFSGYGQVKIWGVVPLLKGIGYGQAVATWCTVSYYCHLMGLTVFYFLSSFADPLPWAICDPEWADMTTCFPSGGNLSAYDTGNGTLESSSEQFFIRYVVKQKFNIDDGIGLPDWKLVLCLLFSWTSIFLVQVKGIKTSGKVAYFTALFPYVVLIVLLGRGATLPGAETGILYFITPQWQEILNPSVWFAAVSQCFFSLSVGFGPIIMFSSYNDFRHNMYRDSTIVSLMDTLTSLLAGFAIFSILGNLAFELETEVPNVVKGGAGLAFISYPDAIAKFDAVPQLFAVLFFIMMFTLGIGSAMALVGGIITIICDEFPHWQRWRVTLALCTAGFGCGIVFTTPGGLFVFDTVDYFGAGFIIYVLVVFETIAISWIYGLNRFFKDIKFMTNNWHSPYWDLMWTLLIPAMLIVIFVFSMVQYKPLSYEDYVFPDALIASGWVLAAFALTTLPAFAFVAIIRQKEEKSFLKKVQKACQPTSEWGPKNEKIRKEWNTFSQEWRGGPTRMKRITGKRYIKEYKKYW
ncbi:sodium-dependent nutrient amino acid transporter 1-like isoform X1 [Artemia franciscana]|uniref:sodium-dependent nutrient amino acid transporter 1-like isoform X1 n=1 Tax=Artemia franciscana TaxID=6661 RepID=UPI0032DA96F3